MDFASRPAGAKSDGANREQLMEQVKAQIAVANAQELLQVRISVNCPARANKTPAKGHR